MSSMCSVCFVAALQVLMAVPADGVANKPRVPQNNCVNAPYWGIVTATTKTSITIQWGDETPKFFVVSEALAAGGIPSKPRLIPGRLDGYHVPPSSMYPLSAVKVGDHVTISFAHLGQLDICDHICIQKRPNGRVPALPEEAENLMNPEALLRAKLPPNIPLPEGFSDGSPYIPHHEYWNAVWDLEDKGIPFPEKFGKNRRFPVAPQPREVKK
jgi:hypothetical protein